MKPHEFQRPYYQRATQSTANHTRNPGQQKSSKERSFQGGTHCMSREYPWFQVRSSLALHRTLGRSNPSVLWRESFPIIWIKGLRICHRGFRNECWLQVWVLDQTSFGPMKYLCHFASARWWARWTQTWESTCKDWPSRCERIWASCTPSSPPYCIKDHQA